MLTAPLTLGIEEEYQIIDPETRELTSYVQELLERGKVLSEDEIKPEFLQSQIEMGTRICRNVEETREEVNRLRRRVLKIADSAGVLLAASGTHPFSHWSDQVVTDKDRYLEFAYDMQQVVRNLLIFGTHIHIGFGDAMPQKELLITVMNQLRYFLPHILALSTSSPFWMGQDTGLKSYRSIVFKALPRTGIPMAFESWSQYENLVQTLTRVGALGKEAKATGDATRIWWDLRPHPKFGTLEVRICDIMTTVDEAVAIAALLQSTVLYLLELRQKNQSWRIYPRDLIEENKWRAVRYGTEGELIDFGQESEVSFPYLMNEFVELLGDIPDRLGSREEVEFARAISQNGSSADRQLKVYRESLKQGKSEQDALKSVVDHIVKETRQGVD